MLTYNVEDTFRSYREIAGADNAVQSVHSSMWLMQGCHIAAISVDPGRTGIHKE